MPVVSRIVECGAPYSFFFSLIEPFWKTPTADSSPLHRLATLARKQGAKALVIEDASAVPDVRQEILTLDDRMGSGGAAEAMLLSFLNEVPDGDDISTISDGALIGQCILINYRPKGAIEFRTSFVYEAIFATPSMESGEPLLNNFINCEAGFQVQVRGRKFELSGLYYAQQNGITSVCAHACIKMAVRTLRPDQPSPSTESINALVDSALPADGMLVEDIAEALSKLVDHQVATVDCTLIKSSEWVSVLTAAADSGDMAFLIFETGSKQEGEPAQNQDEARPTNHVVVVYGYTRNTDEWHPQAIPEYSGAPQAQHSPSSAWVDHFVIHDDNFGPYLTLSTRALEADTTVRAQKIVIIRRLRTNLEPHVAEAAAAIIMAQAAQMFADDATDNRWLNYLLRHRRPLIMRPVLVTREEYCLHLANAKDHDGCCATDAAIEPLRDHLPELLWMIEFTLPDLFTGNHSKLGEILLDANHESAEHFSLERLRGIRVPSRIMLARNGDAKPNDSGNVGSIQVPQDVRNFPLLSHSPIFERNPPARQW